MSTCAPRRGAVSQQQDTAPSFAERQNAARDWFTALMDAHWYRQLARAHLVTLGVSLAGTHAAILWALRDGALRLSDISTALPYHQSDVSRGVAFLERAGYLTRRVPQLGEDRRAVWADLTDKGRELVNQLRGMPPGGAV